MNIHISVSRIAIGIAALTFGVYTIAKNASSIQDFLQAMNTELG